MIHKSKQTAFILADRRLFDYLKEKTDERKTRLEAYCDLLDKASAGFVSPFLKGHEQELGTDQCHVTISDLAVDWRWHRATVRSFLDRMEEYGQLSKTKLAKSIIITMPVSATPDGDGIGSIEKDFAKDVNEVLSAWEIDKLSTEEAGTLIGQLVQTATSEFANSRGMICSDTTLANEQSNDQEHEKTSSETHCTDFKQTAFALIAQSAIGKVLFKSRFDDINSLLEFYHEDLDDDLPSVLEVSKVLAELVIDGKSSSLDAESTNCREQFKSLCKPFKALVSQSIEQR